MRILKEQNFVRLFNEFVCAATYVWENYNAALIIFEI